jgi:ABC-type Fe3+-hydroxamate transport system substrate-binding protein
VLALLLVVLACGDEAVRAPGDELRVISLAPSITRILRALGAEPAIVGADTWSLESLELQGVQSVGGLYAPDLERTVELRPTLVLAVESAQQRPFLDALASRGVRVESIDPYSLDEHLASIERVGLWVGREQRAAQLVEALRRELQTIASRATTIASRATTGASRATTGASNARRQGRTSERAGPPSVALVVERDPLYVVGGGSFVHELIEIAGGRNVFDDLASPFPAVSLEALVVRAPAVLIDATAAYWSGDRSASERSPESMAREARAFWGRFLPESRVEVLARPEVTLPGEHLADSARVLQGLILGDGA